MEQSHHPLQVASAPDSKTATLALVPLPKVFLLLEGGEGRGKKTKPRRITLREGYFVGKQQMLTHCRQLEAARKIHGKAG